MVEIPKIKELKGAALPVLLILAQTRKVCSVRYLCEESGYSDKPVTAALKYLEERQLAARCGRSGYMIAGEEYQLPLSWDERMLTGEIAGRSGVIPGLEERIARLENAVFSPKLGDSPAEHGDFPVKANGDPEAMHGEIPTEHGDIPYEDGDSPKAVNELININNPEEFSLLDGKQTNNNQSITGAELTAAAEIPGEIPAEAQTAWFTVLCQMKGQLDRGMYQELLGSAVLLGYADGHYTIGEPTAMARDWAESRLTGPAERILSAMCDGKQSVSWVIQNAECGMQNDQDSGVRSQGPEPVLTLLSGDSELVDICNDYMVDPTGIEFTTEQLKELVAMNPDPKVLRFSLARLSSFDSVKVWCGWSLKTAKEKLLTKHGIRGAERSELANNDHASLEMIDDICNELCPDNSGLAIWRIKETAKAGVIPE